MKKKTDHVTLRNGTAFCTHCGSELKINFPIEVYLMTAMFDAFTKHHADCEKVWVEPVVDPNAGLKNKMMFWLANGERGISSETIFSVLAGESSWCRPVSDYRHPLDPDDFRRCYLLIKTIPEWKPQLSKMKEVSPVWSKLVDNWDKLTEMLEEQLKTHKRNGMYEFMKGLGC